MRVIAGTARRLKLATLEGLDVRPTTDQIKETLFNIINLRIPGARFLDLFAGSGGIGIEALSRGAKEAVFVERDRRCVNIIRGNLEHTGLGGDARVMPMDFMAALRRLDEEGEAFDIIFMDPPYRKDLERKALEFIDSSSLITAGSLVICETALETEAGDEGLAKLKLEREKTYRSNKHCFYTC